MQTLLAAGESMWLAMCFLSRFFVTSAVGFVYVPPKSVGKESCFVFLSTETTKD